MKILMEKGQCDLNQTIYKANKNKKPIKLIKMRYIWESLLTIVQEIHSKGKTCRHSIIYFVFFGMSTKSRYL